MRVRSFGLAVLTGVMLSAPMIAVMYLADRWLGLSFPPFDTFDWVARELPGPLVTFGIDTMIGLLMFVGLSVKDFAKTAEQLMAVGGFFTAGVVATAVVYAVVQWRGPDLKRELGLLFGAVARRAGGPDDRQHQPVVGEPGARLRVGARAVSRMGVRLRLGGAQARALDLYSLRLGGRGHGRWWSTGGVSSSYEWARRPPR